MPRLVAHWRKWGLIWGAPETVRYSVAFDPDVFVDVAIAMLAESGVRLRMHTSFAGVGLADNAIRGLYSWSRKRDGKRSWRGLWSTLPATVMFSSRRELTTST